MRCGCGKCVGHVGGTGGSGIVSIASDVLWMSVVRRIRGVGGVGEMCMCLARVERIGFVFYQSCGNWGSVGRVSVFGLRWCRWGVGSGLDQGLEGWGDVMSV